MNCVVHHFTPKTIAQVLKKFTHSFVAIELLNFFKNAKNYLLLKRALGIPYVNRIYIFAIYILKRFAKKLVIDI